MPPTKPPRIGIAVIGVIAATFLALMVALGVSALDSSVRGSRDLVALLDLTPIAVVPLIRNAEFGAAAPAATDGFSRDDARRGSSFVSSHSLCGALDGRTGIGDYHV